MVSKSLFFSPLTLYLLLCSTSLSVHLLTPIQLSDACLFITSSKKPFLILSACLTSAPIVLCAWAP